MSQPSRLRSLALFACLSTLFSGQAHGQGSAEDYARAAGHAAATRGLVLNERLDVSWLEGGRALAYTRDLPGGGRQAVLVDAVSGERRELPSLEIMAAAIEANGGAGATGGEATLGFDTEACYLTFAGSRGVWRYDLEHEQAVAVQVDAARPLLLAPRATRTRSGPGGPSCLIRFLNGLDEPLTVYWVPASGAERSYGTLAPRAHFEQATYAGHAWALRAADGSLRAAFRAEVGRPLALVAPPVPAGSTGSAGSVGNTGGGAEARPVLEPEPAQQAFVRDHDVWVRDAGTGEEVRLTTGGTAEAGFGRRVHTSPDGRYAVVVHTTAGDTRQVHYVEAAPRDQLQPKLHSYPYLKPGDAVDHDRPRLFDLVERREVPVDDALFPNPWSITRLAWQPGTSTLTFLYDQRGHQVQRLVALDATTGAARALIDETSPTFIDYSGKTYLESWVHERDGEEVLDYLWASERDGWNHLYQVDGRTGEVRARLTSGAWVVRRVERLEGSGDQRAALLQVSGIFPDQDPYHVHFVRVDLGTGELVHLTEGDGTHELDWSPDGRTFVDRFSRVDLAPVHELRRASDGGLIATLETADASALLATGWRAPERFVAKGRDGEADIWGLIRRPSSFDPERSYPVIESIYAGPHGAFVPKAFHRSSSQAALAELGFLVVQVDGMGTNHRGKAFHDVAWQDLGDSGFPDRRLWIEAAARHEPAMDLTRVGIYGGSAGGQSALRALLAHGDFYHAAVADCGCHDNRVDKIWWNEAWMGWPIGPHYAEQSNVTNAHRLTGDLLLIVGEADENVDPASTMQVVDALIRADKDFELLVMPGVGHGAAGTPYGTRRLRDFFVRKLLGVEPRWD